MTERLQRGPTGQEREKPLTILSRKDVRIRRAIMDENTASARLLTAEEYAKFCTIRGDEEVRKEAHNDIVLNVLRIICLDTYGRDSSTSLLIAEPNTQHPGPQETFGAARMVKGDSGREYFIEAAQLFDFTKDLPHRRAGLSDEQVAELGRVVVSKGHRPHNTRVILSRIMNGVTEILTDDDIRGLYITLPTRSPARLYDHLSAMGYNLTQVEGATVSENDYAREIRAQFPGYWVDLDPRLFYLRVPDRKSQLRTRLQSRIYEAKSRAKHRNRS